VSVRRWPSVSLGEICEIVSGITKDSKKQGDDYREVPYLRVANVQRLQLDLSEVKMIPAKESAINTYRLEPGDILLNEGGDRDKLGRGWIWQGQIDECIHQNHVFRARIRCGKAIPKWIAYYANTNEARAYFLKTGKQTTNLASISKKNLGALPIPLPPVKVQESIVCEIDTQISRLDETVTTLQGIQARLKQARASILKAAVEGRLVEAINASELSTAQDDLSHGRCIPSHWQTRLIRDLFDQRLGKMLDKAKNSGDLTPYLRNANVRWQSFDLDDLKLMRISDKERQEISVKHGDIVVCEGGEPGRCAVWKSYQNVVIQKALHRLRARERLNPAFFSYQLEDAVSRGKIDQFYTGSTIKHLTGAKLKQIVLATPPLEEQDIIVAEVERRFSVLDQVETTVQASLARCGLLRQAILKSAFEGRLVPAPGRAHGPADHA
jgi:type I restriction enzyme S subunit